MLPGELTAGDPVGLEVHLPSVPALRTRALVRYSDRLRCGMEFVGVSPAQQAAIREWAELAKAPAESDFRASNEDIAARDTDLVSLNVAASGPGNSGGGAPPRTGRARRRLAWVMFLIAAALLAGAFWWRWNRGWEEIEAGLSPPVASSSKPTHVPAEVMQQLLVHRVDPEYPAAARPGRLHGVIVLDVVIGPDGSVVEVHPLNGPDVLSRAAVEAFRWWKFQPYRENGQPVAVETTVAVEFKSPGIGDQKAGRGLQ